MRATMIQPPSEVHHRFTRVSWIFGILLFAVVSGSMAIDDKQEERRNFDARIELNRGVNVVPETQRLEALRTMEATAEPLAATFDRTTGVVRTLYNPTGFVTQAVAGIDPSRVATDFVTKNHALLGLTTGDMRGYESETVVSADTGTQRVYMHQQHLGRPVYNGQLQVNVDQNGRILSINNGFMPNLAEAANQAQPEISAEAAIEAAFEHLGGVDGEASKAELNWLPIRKGDARLVWRFQIATADGQHHYDFTVDAVSGRVWTRIDWVASDSFRVYEAPIESPIHTQPGPPSDDRTLQVNPEHPVSQDSWIDGGTTIMDGNNVHACLDTDANNVCDAGEPNCAGAPLSCDFPIDLTMGPAASQAAAVTNLFYWNNYIHDTQYLYGFDEASGNFQEDNFALGGADSDSVNADAQDGGGNCNANFFTPADGSNPRMQMFTCTNANPDRDGDFDNLVIVHEYAHGISNRLVGGPNNVSCLGNLQQPGEGWSDLFGLIYTHQAGAAGTDARGVGSYLFDLPAVGGTIRTFPYSTDFAVNPDTYSVIAGRSVPHGVGSVWAEIAWEAYWEIVNLRGFDPDLQNVAVNAGNHRMMRYFTEGLKNTPCNPTFIDARDGVIVAAITNGLEDVCPLWRAFARRGLGVDATTNGPNSLVATDGFAIPPQCEEPPPEIQVPGPLDFGSVCVGSSKTMTLDVCNSGPGDLEVDPIMSSDAQFVVSTPSSGHPLVVGTGNCFPFQVTFTPSSTGPQAGTLTIPSNDPVNSNTMIAVSGNGTEQDVTVTGSKDFGVVSAWSPGEKTVSICNTGHCDLALTGAAINCPDFALVSDPSPTTVGPGSCVDLVVSFTPTVQGPVSCQLSINSDDPDTPVVVRDLTAHTAPYFSLHAGLVEPHGALGAVADRGSVLNLDFVFPFTPSLAWDVRLGVGKLDGQPGLPDVDVSKLGANIKFLINPAAPVRFFLNGGLNLYHFDPGDFEGGGNVGLGLNVPAGQLFAFEATYNYNSAFTASPSLEFDEFQLGFLVSF